MIDEKKLIDLKVKIDVTANSSWEEYKLIYDWIKQGHISLGEFRKLIEYIHED